MEMKQEMRSRAKNKNSGPGDARIIKWLFSVPLTGVTTEEDIEAFRWMFEYRKINPENIKTQQKWKPPTAWKEEGEWRYKTFGSDEDY